MGHYGDTSFWMFFQLVTHLEPEIHFAKILYFTNWYNIYVYLYDNWIWNKYYKRLWILALKATDKSKRSEPSSNSCFQHGNLLDKHFTHFLKMWLHCLICCTVFCFRVDYWVSYTWKQSFYGQGMMNRIRIHVVVSEPGIEFFLCSTASIFLTIDFWHLHVKDDQHQSTIFSLTSIVSRIEMTFWTWIETTIASLGSTICACCICVVLEFCFVQCVPNIVPDLEQSLAKEVMSFGERNLPTDKWEERFNHIQIHNKIK